MSSFVRALSPVLIMIALMLFSACGGELPPDPGGCPTYYADVDGDGYGNAGVEVQTCFPALESVTVVDNYDDCDDHDAEAFPGNPEICDDADNDCNGLVDEGVLDGKSLFYIDNDRDGWGSYASTVKACFAPAGYSAQGGDCDDDDPEAYPGSTSPSSTCGPVS